MEFKTGRQANLKDVRWEPLYDTITIGAGALTRQSVRFFSAPISATKTKNETNMVAAAQLPAPQAFRCYGMKVEAIITNAADLALLASLGNDSWIRFFVGSKDYLKVPFQAVTGKSTLAIDGLNSAAGAPVAHVQLGKPCHFGYKFPKEYFIDISATENFGVEWNINTNVTLTAPVDFKFYLEGLRGVDVR